MLQFLVHVGLKVEMLFLSLETVDSNNAITRSISSPSVVDLKKKLKKTPDILWFQVLKCEYLLLVCFSLFSWYFIDNTFNKKNNQQMNWQWNKLSLAALNSMNSWAKFICWGWRYETAISSKTVSKDTLRICFQGQGSLLMQYMMRPYEEVCNGGILWLNSTKLPPTFWRQTFLLKHH